MPSTMAEEELFALMERLRQKSGEQRSWGDSIKALRSATAEKRHLVETLDRIQIQRCLDTLQSAIKVLGQQSMSSRLRCIAQQTSLNFTEKPPNNVIISSDLFCVEVCLDPEKSVKDVRIAHQGEATSCPELLRLLSCGDFQLFTKHLEGFTSSYTITGDKKQKTKAFHALQSLENDLNLVAQLQSSINGVGNYIHKSPLGILIPRSGGLPMKLIYFVSPYDLLDKKTKAAHPMTVEAIMEYELGESVTVCLDSSSYTELQTMPLMTVNSLQDGKSLPYFSALSAMNSCSLPACFVLRLPKAIPLSVSVARKIYTLTNIDVCDGLESRPLLSLIVEEESGEKMGKDTKLFVTLPNQHHQYFLQEGCGSDNHGAVLVSKIPFTHPTHVPKILGYLRQQLLFNALIGSCIRPSPNQEGSVDRMTFEVTALSLHHVTVAFEHPFQQAIASAELDLSDITNVTCKVLSSGESEPFVSDEQATKVFQRCLSIPVTMRAILMKVTGQLKKLIAEDKVKSSQRQRLVRPVPPLIIPRQYTGGSNRVLQHQNSAPLPHHQRALIDYEHPALLDPTSASPELLDTLKAEKVAKNPMLASLLDQETGLKDVDSPVLTKLLDDRLPTVSSLPNQAKQKKTRKRKLDTLQSRSPKHPPSEDGLSDRSFELETPSPLDVRLSASSGGLTTPVIDLTDSDSPFLAESHVSKLAHTVNKIMVDSIKTESSNLTELPQGQEGHIVNNVELLTDRGIKWEAKDNATSKRSSISDLWSDAVESDGPIDPDLFTNKTVSSKLKCSVSRQSSVSQHSDMIEFDTDSLNAETNFSESLTVNGSEEMGWDACDASAFGVGVNPLTEMASKLSSASSSVVKAAKAPAVNFQPSKFTHDAFSAGIKRGLSETSESAALMKVKTESNSPKPIWKKPDIELLNTWKSSDCDLGVQQRGKSESDSVFFRKSESDSCLSRKKSESDSVFKNTSFDSDNPSRKKSENETLLKKRLESDTCKEKGEGYLSESSHGSRKKTDSDSNSVTKKLDNDIASNTKKKSESSGVGNLSKCDGDNVLLAKKKYDSVLNTSKRKSESEISSGKPISEESSMSNSLSSTNTNWIKPDQEGQGLKMKISTRKFEGRSVSSPLQVLDLSKNNKSNSKNSKDSSFDRGGVAMAVTSVAYNSSTLKGSSSPLLNSSISPKIPSFPTSKTANYSPSSKSPSSHNTEKTSRSNKIDKSKKTKHSSNSESAKRKREKDEHKREKKKKKLEDLKQQSSVKEDLFYSATVDYLGLNDKKKMPKLKITKTGGKVTVQTSSPEKGVSVMKTVSSPRKSSQASISIDDAFSFSRSEILEKEELRQNLSKPRLHSSSSKQTNHSSSSRSSSSSSQRSSHKSSQKSSSKSITVSKADSKLITKTPTIKLKPIDITSSGSSLNVSSSSKSPGSNVHSTPQSAPVLSALSNRLNMQSPHLSPTRNSSRSPTSIIGSLSGPVSVNSTPSTPSTPTSTNKSGLPPNLVLSSASVSAKSASANKIKSPGRLRKGSLSAVIDKLTKSTAVTTSSKGDTPAEGISRAKALAAVVSQQSSQGKIGNSTNSLSKSLTKSPSSAPSNKGISNSEREKSRTLNDSLSSVQKDSPKRDKADSGHKSRSESLVDKSTQRKSTSSSYHDKKSVSSGSSNRNSKDDKNKNDNTSSKQSIGHSSKSSSSVLSNNQSPSTKHQINNVSRVSSSPHQSRKSTSSPSQKYNNSPSTNQKVASSTSVNQKSGNSPSTIQKVANNASSGQKSSNSANVIQKGGSSSSANSSKTANSNDGSSSQNSAFVNNENAGVSSKTSAKLPSSLSVVLTSANNKSVSRNSSNSSTNSSSSTRVKEKVSQSSQKHYRKQPSENTQKIKSAKLSSGNEIGERSSSQDSQTSCGKMYSSNNDKVNLGGSSVENEYEGRVDFDTWTPASPTEDKEHRTAEETAKIPVLERLQLEYTQESSNSPKVIPTIPQEAVRDNQPAKQHTSLLSGLLQEEDSNGSSEKTSFTKFTGGSNSLCEADVPSLFSQCNGGTTDTLSASECKSPNMKDLPFSKHHTGNTAMNSDSGTMELSSPKAKKQRTSSLSNCTSHQVSSPHSEASSPGSDLVIDCPTTPKSNCLMPASPSHSKSDPVTTPCSSQLHPVKKVSPGPSPVKLPRYSPAASPVFKASSNSGSASPCPVDIDDDDLMDDIVLGMGS